MLSAGDLSIYLLPTDRSTSADAASAISRLASHAALPVAALAAEAIATDVPAVVEHVVAAAARQLMPSASLLSTSVAATLDPFYTRRTR